MWFQHKELEGIDQTALSKEELVTLLVLSCPLLFGSGPCPPSAGAAPDSVGISRVLEVKSGQKYNSNLCILVYQWVKREAECSQHGSVVSSGQSHGSGMLRRCL